jgi:uncharacterized membrane protein YfcA
MQEETFTNWVPILGFEISDTMMILMISGGFIAGFIDSIVGGGGLITVPIFLLALGPNASAIGTNKVAAVAAQLAAFAVYFQNRQVDEIRGRSIFLITALGAIFGALLAPKLPSEFFKWFLLVITPAVIAMVLTKRIWSRSPDKPAKPRLAMLGSFSAGFYDGVAGPGGGTMMFLSLFIIGGMPAAIAMGTGKLANLGSALTSLATYGLQGEVRWLLGFLVAVPISIGAWAGAKFATRLREGESLESRARDVSRAALVVVSCLLLVRWITLQF